MEAPDGQLYEVVESIGEDGTVRRSVRRVWLKIPAAIGPRRVRRGVRILSSRRRHQSVPYDQELLCGAWFVRQWRVPSAAFARR